MSTIDLGITTRLQSDFDTAVARTREALAAQGFGVLTEIDMAATLKAKLDVDVAPYLILGACNPPLAHAAVGANAQIGLLLPCNVVVRADEGEAGTVVVEAMNPDLMVQITGDPAVEKVATEATEKLRAAIAALG